MNKTIISLSTIAAAGLSALTMTPAHAATSTTTLRHFAGAYTSQSQCNYYHDGVIAFAKAHGGKVTKIGSCHIGRTQSGTDYTYGYADYTTTGAKYSAGDKNVSTWHLYRHMAMPNGYSYQSCENTAMGIKKKVVNNGGWVNFAVGGCHVKGPVRQNNPQYTYNFVDVYATAPISSGDKIINTYGPNDLPAQIAILH